jgi:hypothetical protein
MAGLVEPQACCSARILYQNLYVQRGIEDERCGAAAACRCCDCLALAAKYQGDSKIVSGSQTHRFVLDCPT